MSPTMTVPLAVPSLFHSCSPRSGSEARKNNVPLTFVSSAGDDRRRAGHNVFQQYRPSARTVALPDLISVSDVVGHEESRPLMPMNSKGYELRVLTLMSRVRTVPLAVPCSSTTPFLCFRPSLGRTRFRWHWSSSGIRTARRVDILHQHGAAGRAVAFPKFIRAARIAREEQCSGQIPQGPSARAADVATSLRAPSRWSFHRSSTTRHQRHLRPERTACRRRSSGTWDPRTIPDSS